MTQKSIAGPIEGYKIVNKDMTCRDFKFEVGVHHKLPNNDSLELCKNGFHFCKYPSGVWAYYQEGRVFKVRAYGVLEQPKEPGADYKMVCSEIELYEEIAVTGDGNTGYGNTGYRNTGDGNTGDGNTGNGNTGDGNTGEGNTGYENTGYGNTGYGNTGYRNTGYRNTGNGNTGNGNTGDGNTGEGNTGYENTGDGNTGDGNTGNGNTGDGNTGDGNTGDFHSGSLNYGNAPIYLFNKITNVKSKDIPWGLVNRLSALLQQDNEICPDEFLSIPNATEKAIKLLHEAHKKARKMIGGKA